ncbi:MAG: hypothetical protein KDB37_16130 [Ilumatobacter sp.]|nr:hypothetical protein [Ilumatobacter sp.]
MRGKIAGMVAVACALTACSGGDDEAVTTSTSPPETTTETTATSGTTEPSTDTPATTADTAADTTPPTTDAAMPGPAPDDLVAAIEADLATAPAGCDPLDPRQCVLPYPSNATTIVDDTTATGLRVAFPADGLPANADGVHIDPTDWNLNDGFSPNSSILTHVPGLDAEASDLPRWDDLGASLDDDATVVIVDDVGERVALWAEPDVDVTGPDDEILVIHPAVALAEGGTYHVAIRGMVDSSGAEVEPSAAFVAYRDALTTDLDEIEARRPDMESTFELLEGAGIGRSDLQLAWSFTVASTDSITGRMLHIRDETLTELGAAAPAFTVTEVVEPPELDREGLSRQIVGTYTVPNWLTGDGGPGNRFDLDDDGNPTLNGTLEAPFVCNVSDATMTGTEPAHLVQYGHGLLGSNFEINAGNVRAMSNEHNVVHCATKWAGMSEDDIGNAASVLTEVSAFPTMADRLQQGVLNQIVLGRLMLADDGLVSDPAFSRPDGSLLVDNSTLYYDGNSQGGIMGLMLAGVSPDFERAVLGVPGMNYSMLLPRSVDFDTYEAIMEPAYPSTLDRMLTIAVMQMLWDRAEGAGYMHHVVSDPLPGTNAKQVLMHVAYGDHQVTELSALVEARTMGIPIHRPVAADGRYTGDPTWGLDDAVDGESTSAIVIWDSGMAPIPFEARPSREGDDSHEDPRADPDARVQKAAFLFDGQYVDVCAGAPCTADHVD